MYLTSTIGLVELVCGRAAEAVGPFARTCEIDESTGELAGLSTDAATYAHALLLAGEPAAARQQVNRALEFGATNDVLTQGLARSALAWVSALDGEDPGAIRGHLADGLDALEPTDMLLYRALVHIACSEASRLIGDEPAALHHRQQAIDLYDTKGNLVGASYQRALL